MDYASYRKILEEVKIFKNLLKSEKNIFSIGTKGHYENPISDILAFFLDPSKEHNLNDLCLLSLLSCMPSSVIANFNVSSFVNLSREIRTTQGNRIDIFIEGKDWTITIENKIRALMTNPLTDYYNYIEKEYSSKFNYFIILSTQGFNHSGKWVNVTYKNLIDNIQNNIGKYFLNENIGSNFKWIILLREFLLNITVELGEKSMNKELLDFVENNYSEIIQLLEYKEEYHSYIRDEGDKIIQDVTNVDINFVEHSTNNWKIATAIHFYIPSQWGKKTCATIAICNDKSFKIRAYIHNLSNDQIALAKTIFQSYDQWLEAHNTFTCFGKESIIKKEECFSIFLDTLKS